VVAAARVQHDERRVSGRQQQPQALAPLGGHRQPPGAIRGRQARGAAERVEGRSGVTQRIVLDRAVEQREPALPRRVEAHDRRRAGAAHEQRGQPQELLAVDDDVRRLVAQPGQRGEQREWRARILRLVERQQLQAGELAGDEGAVAAQREQPQPPRAGRREERREQREVAQSPEADEEHVARRVGQRAARTAQRARGRHADARVERLEDLEQAAVQGHEKRAETPGTAHSPQVLQGAGKSRAACRRRSSTKRSPA
jgi:hypothetical protein